MTNEDYENKKIYFEQQLAIETNSVYFKNKETNEPYSCIDFRFNSLDFKEFHLGEVVIRDKYNGIYFANEKQRNIENWVFDGIFSKEYQMINGEMEIHDKSMIKLPSVYMKLDDGNYKYDCIATIRKGGWGTIAFITERNKKYIEYDINGYYSEYDYYKVDQKLIERKRIYYLFKKFIMNIMNDLEIIDYKPYFKTQLVKSKNYMDKSLFLEYAKQSRMINIDYQENMYIKNDFKNISTCKWHSAYFDGFNLAIVYDKIYNQSFFLDYYCPINYYLIEKTKLLKYINVINSTDFFDEELFIKYLNNMKHMDYYNFAWSMNPKLTERIKQLMNVNKIYDELLKIYKYNTIQKEIIDRKNKEIKYKKEKIKEFHLTTISAFASCLVVIDVIDILYDLEISPIFNFPINISKLIAIIIIAFAFAILEFNNISNNHKK